VLINWFTVIAQIVNFLILVFLLKYFLYDRIVKAMDEREQRIQLRLKEAEEKKQEAEQEARSYLEKNRDFDAKREEMLAQARKEADARRKELTEKARLAVNNLRSVWLEAIQRDKKSFIQDLRKMAGSQVYTIARKAFRDLADAGVEERTVAVFLAQIQGMTKKKQEGLAASIREGGNEVVIRSAFEIPAKMREKITAKLHRAIADGIQVRYESASELIMGIELKTRGRKIAWSLQGYLDTLEEHSLQSLEKEAQRKPARAPAEQGEERNQEQTPDTKRARPKTDNRNKSKETDETTTQ
jgi:F-type H+-transporting ATPase subunit b